MAPPVKLSDEDKEKLIYQEAARGARIEEISECCGYSVDYVRKLLKSPFAVSRVRAEVLRRAVVEGAGVAMTTLIEIAGDKEATRQNRIDASKAVLDRAGILAHLAEQSGVDLSLAEMTRDQLLLVANSAANELAVRSKAVDAPIAPAHDSQPIDIFE